MSRSTRTFVRRAPSKVDKSRWVDVRVTDMAAADAAWWDARVGAHHTRIQDRADRFWVWSVMLPLCHLVQLAKRRQCRPLVVWARTNSGRFLRVGMSILIESYPYLDAARELDAGFVWFISAADTELLKREFDMSHPPSLGRVLLDNAVVLSQNLGLEGRLGLHAAAAGGDALLHLYRGCGLTRLSAAAPLPVAITRRNDGRFFYADETQAERMAALLDPSR